MSEFGSRSFLRDHRTLAVAAVLALFAACDQTADPVSAAGQDADAAEASGTVVARVGDAIALGEPPLVVVDGVVRGRGAEAEMLDASEIESLEAVKGPAAERLYGERGADGVIQITTKAAAAREGDNADAVTRWDVIEARMRLREDTSEMTLRLEDGRRVRLMETPAVDAGEERSVQLRGRTSMGTDGAPNPPLIVVDGVILGRDVDLAELNALDIESIEILKGEAAERLRGERAADGVIQITTKDGADGGS